MTPPRPQSVSSLPRRSSERINSTQSEESLSPNQNRIKLSRKGSDSDSFLEPTLKKPKTYSGRHSFESGDSSPEPCVVLPPDNHGKWKKLKEEEKENEETSMDHSELQDQSPNESSVINESPVIQTIQTPVRAGSGPIIADPPTESTSESSPQPEKPSTEQVAELLDVVFKAQSRVNFKICSGELFVIGSEEDAERVSKKFRIMSKLACLVGCGLDCHFRLVEDRFRLLMLIRGAPRAVFGSVITVSPDLRNMRKQAAPVDLVEIGQREFFDSILNLIPQSMKQAKNVLLNDMLNGDETSRVAELYTFLRGIRSKVLHTIAKLPIAWAVDDHNRDSHAVDITYISSAVQLCGDSHLIELEKEHPGFEDAWSKSLGLETAETQTFNELMEEKFNAI